MSVWFKRSVNEWEASSGDDGGAKTMAAAKVEGEEESMVSTESRSAQEKRWRMIRSAHWGSWRHTDLSCIIQQRHTDQMETSSL
jgi:hypothetical protein